MLALNACRGMAGYAWQIAHDDALPGNVKLGYALGGANTINNMTGRKLRVAINSNQVGRPSYTAHPWSLAKVANSSMNEVVRGCRKPDHLATPAFLRGKGPPTPTPIRDPTPAAGATRAQARMLRGVWVVLDEK